MDDDYTLVPSESELKRYRRMTADAVAAEAEIWAAAGVVPGATVADVGCGPGMVLAELAKAVQPGGHAVGVDHNDQALHTARSVLAQHGIANATVQRGSADRTGLEPGKYDVVMLRHVLLHNPRPALRPNLGHLAGLLAQGGSLVLAETDGQGVRWERPPHSVVVEMMSRYNELLRRKGCEVSIGPLLGALVTEAGFEVARRAPRYDVILPRQDGRRPFSWDSRDALLEAGLATNEEVEGWDRDLASLGPDTEPLSFLPVFVVVARRPVGANDGGEGT